jgi:hypothetical protein
MARRWSPTQPTWRYCATTFCGRSADLDQLGVPTDSECWEGLSCKRNRRDPPKDCQDLFSLRGADRSAEPTNAAVRHCETGNGPDGTVSHPSQQSEAICSAPGWPITYVRQSSGAADVALHTVLTVIRGAPAKLSIVRSSDVQQFTLCCLDPGRVLALLPMPGGSRRSRRAGSL